VSFSLASASSCKGGCVCADSFIWNYKSLLLLTQKMVCKDILTTDLCHCVKKIKLKAV